MSASLATLSLVQDVDPDKWSATVTQTQTYAYTSPDGNTTTTGTATFTWTRVTLASKLTYPKLLFGDLPDAINVQAPGASPMPGRVNLAPGEYLVVRCAAGKMPGWLIYFGAQAPVANAFTHTVKHPGTTPPTPDTVTHMDATAQLSATCAPVAPDQTIFAGQLVDGAGTDAARTFRRAFVGQNTAVVPDASAGSGYNDTYTVELIRAGAFGTDTTPDTFPVYRVTFPEAARFYKVDCTITINGSDQRIEGSGAFLVYVDGLMQNWLGHAGTVYQRDLHIYEVEMYTPDGTLGAGTLTQWLGAGTVDSFLTSATGAHAVDPFALKGSAFTYSGVAGFSETIHF